MKNEIREAYDRMNPPREAKERMMKNIMKRQNKRGMRYSAAAVPQRWWTAIPAALALVAVLAVGWRVLIPGATPAPIATNPGETTAPTAYVGLDVLKLDELFPDVPEEYLDIVGNYYSGLKSNTDSTVWEKLGLNPAAYENLNVIDGLGYALMDLDGNGTEELLITDGDQVYDLYVQVDGEVRELLANRIHHQGKRNSIKLCGDNTLMVWQRSAGVDYIHWWRLGKDGLGDIALVCEETVSAGDDGKWYAGPNDKDAVEVTEEEAREILNSREPVFVNYTPICPERFVYNFQEILPAGYGHVIGKYITAYTEKWTPEEYMHNDICYVLGMKDSIWEYGYTLIDLDGNGIQELIITDGERIYDMFTLLEDGGPGHILSAGERLRYFLCDDNVIGYYGSGGAAYTVLGYYTLENGMDLVTQLCLEFNTDTWYQYESGGYNDPHPGPLVAISEDEARHIQDAHPAVEIIYQNFLRDEIQQELIYPRTYVQLLREMMAKHSGMDAMHVALADVTGDGYEELLLGLRSNDSFGHVYSVMYGGVKEILTYGSDSDFTLCRNGVICHHQTDKPFGNYTFISLEGGEYKILEIFAYDEDEKSWARTSDGTKEYISDAEMREILDSYGSVSLDWMSVLEAIDSL